MSQAEDETLSPAATQLMAIEVISELLVSVSPQKLGEALTEQLRELSGARTVMVLAHRPQPDQDELLHVSPLRRADLFSAAELGSFCFEKSPGELPYSPSELPDNHPLKAVLLKAGIHSMARFALRAGGEVIGLLLLFDLPGVDRLAETNHIIALLAPAIALALKNALAYFQVELQAQELEKRVEERTAELHQKSIDIRQSEERHRTILQTAMDGFWLVSAEKCILEANDAYCLMSGYSKEELRGMRITALEAEEGEEETAARARRIIDQGGDRFESRHRRKDGGAFYVEISIKYLPLDGGRFAVFIRDIDERKRSEEQLKNLSQRLQLATAAAHIGVWDWNAGENSMVWDDRMLELYGMTPETFQNSIDAWMDALHPDDRGRAVAEYLAALNGEREFDTVFRIRRPDGTVRHIKANALVTRGIDGTAERMIGINVDITEQVRANEEKARLEGQLIQAQKMESVGRLAGGVAHDFNNMLTAILGHAELGLMHLDPAHPVCDDLREISKSAQRSADLTRQLLAFARKQTVAPLVLELNDTVAEMLKMLRRLIGEEVHLSWQPAPELWQVKIDPSQIDQILANLCVNASDAIKGSGRITIETENCSIDPEYCNVNAEARPGEYVRLTVSDDGSGMDKETLAHVFEPFYTTKELGKGTGLGLATVYGVVKQNDGFINIYSEPGEGTTFSIYLPRHEGGREAVKGGGAEPPLRGQETILLAEDEPAILNIVTTMLEEQGYSVLKAATPGEALRLAREHAGEIHLLMTDVVMPEMNGRDLARNLLSIYPHMKRLFMSGYTADVIAHHGILDEGVHFIQKPFSLPDMAARVREVLDGERG